MISFRSFYVQRRDPHKPLGTYKQYREGWFLFGFIPLYVRDA